MLSCHLVINFDVRSDVKFNVKKMTKFEENDCFFPLLKNSETPKAKTKHKKGGGTISN